MRDKKTSKMVKVSASKPFMLVYPHKMSLEEYVAAEKVRFWDHKIMKFFTIRSSSLCSFIRFCPEIYSTNLYESVSRQSFFSGVRNWQTLF